MCAHLDVVLRTQRTNTTNMNTTSNTTATAYATAAARAGVGRSTIASAIARRHLVTYYALTPMQAAVLLSNAINAA